MASKTLLSTSATSSASQKITTQTFDNDNEKPQDAPLPTPLPSFPDGGFTAWLQCAGAFAMLFNSWGLVNAFGVFQDFYTATYIPHESSSNVSWIGSTQAFLLVFGCCVTGPLLDLGYLQPVILTGSFLVVFGMMMTSLSVEYWQLLLSQGIVIGIGYSCLFMPSIGVLPTYFSKKRALAMGIATTGTSIGGIVYPLIFINLQPSIGFGWTVRIMGFIALVMQIIPLLGMKQRIRPAKARRLVDMAALRDIPFIAWLISCFFAFLGLYIPLFYLQPYALQEHVAPGTAGKYLQVLINAGSFFGRLIPNAIADKIGPMNTLTPLVAAAGVLAFAWIRATTSTGLVVLSILYGAFSGSFLSLSPSINASLCPDLSVLGTWQGMNAVAIAIGLLIGNPVGGALLKHGYLGLQVFCGVAILVGLAALVIARVFETGLMWHAKA